VIRSGCHDPPMELWELIARESIRDCIARYNANADSGRWDGLMVVFAPDAVFEASDEVVRGHAAIRAYFSAVAERARDDGEPDRDATAVTPRQFIRHFTATTQIDVLNEAEARARSYYMVLTAHGVDHWGRYIDEYGAIDGRWLITKRVVTTDAAFAGGWGATALGPGYEQLITRGITG
jgi:hypothetical protein